MKDAKFFNFLVEEDKLFRIKGTTIIEEHKLTLLVIEDKNPIVVTVSKTLNLWLILFEHNDAI
jgi:hypothetical protein